MLELSKTQILEICEGLGSDNGGTGTSSGSTPSLPPKVALTGVGVQDAAASVDLVLPPDLLTRLAAALSHSNVRLIGPPGTGKSTLAKAVLEAAVGDSYIFSVATGQWTSEDIIGGPTPDPSDPTQLMFQPGLVLSAAEAGQWVGIDEMNRADIDAAFGELFGLMAGFDLELPYKASPTNDKRVRIYAERPEGTLDVGEYGLPPGWRMIATMNSWDKLSLNRVSFAFSRRWCTVFLPVPAPDAFKTILSRLFQAQLPDAPEGLRLAFEFLFASDSVEDVPTLRSLGLALGPGLAVSCAKDVAAMLGRGMAPGAALAASAEGFLLPQFEGSLEHHDSLVSCLAHALGLAGAPADAIQEMDAKLAVFTGRRKTTSY